MMAKKKTAATPPGKDIFGREVDAEKFEHFRALAVSLGLESHDLEETVKERLDDIADIISNPGSGGSLDHQLAFLVSENPYGLEEELRNVAKFKGSPAPAPKKAKAPAKPKAKPKKSS
jgi:hypothetical protein